MSEDKTPGQATTGNGVVEAELKELHLEERIPEAPAGAPAEHGDEDDSSSSSSASSLGHPDDLHPTDGARAGPREAQAPTAALPGDARVGLLYDQSMEQHLGPVDHPERPSRLIALHARLEDEGLMERCWQLPARKATDEELLLAHTAEHIQKVDTMFERLYPGRPADLADATYCYADSGMGDVYVCGATAEAARVAAGCVVEAVHSVLSGATQRCLAVVRPPGHHAECERAMGFCFFNNVAVAALAALKQPGVKRVAVLDWDVHHGNGIQHILYDNPDALYISLHRDPKHFYPYHSGFVGEAGSGAGVGRNVNIPWAKKGMGDGDYMAAFRLVVEPILTSFAPDLVIVAAGFDAAEGDPLGGCKLTPEGYAWMTERLMALCGGRLVMALEGGYNNRITSWCAAACVGALLAGSAQPPLPQDRQHCWPADAHNSLKLVYEFQQQYWPVLARRSWSDAWEAHIRDIMELTAAHSRPKRGQSGAGAAPPATAATAATAVAAAEGRSGSASSSASAAAAAAAAAAPPSSLQEAFQARKAAREAAAAAIRAAAAARTAGSAAAEATAAVTAVETATADATATATGAGPPQTESAAEPRCASPPPSSSVGSPEAPTAQEQDVVVAPPAAAVEEAVAASAAAADVGSKPDAPSREEEEEAESRRSPGAATHGP